MDKLAVLLAVRQLPIPDGALADWNRLIRLAAWCDGHGRCGGILLTRNAHRITCTCGGGYEITDPAVAA